MAAAKVLDAGRLAAYREEWLRLLEAALPEPEEAGAGVGGSAEAEEAAGAATGAAAGTAASAAVAPVAGAPAAPEAASAVEGTGAGAAPVVEGPGSFLALGLERLFGDARPCRQDEGAAQATGRARGQGTSFRVNVPQQYPGVQYRKSKNLNDRYPRYAKSGTVVTGHIEDDGEWLRISDQVFLPMKVSGIQILEQLPHDASGDGRESGRGIKSLWFACSQGGHGEEQEVVTDLKETN